mgnify:CR=1 FL=1
MRVAIRRISPFGALLYGLLIGLAFFLIPGAVLGWLARAVVVALGNWLNGLQFTIPLPIGEGITIDLPAALSLGDTQARLAALASQDIALVLAVALGTIAAGMLLTGLTALLAALLYNLFAGVFGGVQVTLDGLEVAARRPVETAALAARPAPPQPAARPQPDVAPVALTAWLTSRADSQRRPLSDGVTRIGSAPDNDIVLPGLAPQHAEIRRESGRYLLYDLGSRRTWVNDTQVAAVHMLKDGFRVQLGQAEFIVHIGAAGTANGGER